MQVIRFVAIVLCSGAISGLILGATNIVLVEPYLDVAIMNEAQEEASSIEPDEIDVFWFEYDKYRQWQKGGAVLAAVLLGTAVSALYGLVYALYAKSLPSTDRIQKAHGLAAAMWLALYIVPFIKYPPVLPGDGDAETLAMRTAWYVTLIILSGVTTISLYHVSRTLTRAKKLIPIIAGITIISVSIVAMPSNPDIVSSPQDTLNAFRATSLVSVTIYWVMLGIVFSLLWRRFGHDLQVGA